MRTEKEIIENTFNQLNILIHSLIKYLVQAYGIAYIAIFGGIYTLAPNSHWIPKIQVMLGWLTGGLAMLAIGLSILYVIGHATIDAREEYTEYGQEDDYKKLQFYGKVLRYNDFLIFASAAALIVTLVIFTWNFNSPPVNAIFYPCGPGEGSG